MSHAASKIARLSAALAAQTARAQAAEAELAQARALASCTDAIIQELKLEIAKLRRDKYGISSERRARLIDQLELQLEELEAAATEDALAAEQAADKTSTVRAFTRRKPVRKPFPDHLPRERHVVEAPTSCTYCGSDRVVKMGEDITETLEVIPRQWKVIQTVREKFTCRACEKISQPPAPFHAIPRGWAGPQLIAMIAFDKYGQHQPLNRQSERIAREGIELSLSTLADLIGHACVALTPIHALIARHVLAACTVTIPPCRFWRVAAQGRRDCGPMCAMIDRGMGVRHLPHSSTSQQIAGKNTQHGIWPNGTVFFSRTCMAATMICISQIVVQARSVVRCVGAMQGASSLNWPTSRP